MLLCFESAHGQLSFELGVGQAKAFGCQFVYKRVIAEVKRRTRIKEPLAAQQLGQRRGAR